MIVKAARQSKTKPTTTANRRAEKCKFQSVFYHEIIKTYNMRYRSLEQFKVTEYNRFYISKGTIERTPRLQNIDVTNKKFEKLAPLRSFIEDAVNMPIALFFSRYPSLKGIYHGHDTELYNRLELGVWLSILYRNEYSLLCTYILNCNNVIN